MGGSALQDITLSTASPRKEQIRTLKPVRTLKSSLWPFNAKFLIFEIYWLQLRIKSGLSSVSGFHSLAEQD